MGVTKTGTAKIRRLTRQDIPTIVGIEKRCGESHWDEKILAKKWSGAQGAVCLLEDKVLGYIIYKVNENHFQIYNLTVDENYRRKGVGRHMMKRLCANLTPRRPQAKIVVRESNLSAQLFLKSLGFECDRILKAYFGDEVSPKNMQWEDGYHFVFTQQE